MLYQIDGKYYMLRNREYIKVDISLNDNELSVKPIRKDGVIEKNDKVNAKGVLIEDLIKDLKKPKNSLPSDSTNRKFDR